MTEGRSEFPEFDWNQPEEGPQDTTNMGSPPAPPVDATQTETLAFPPTTQWNPPGGQPLHDDTIGTGAAESEVEARPKGSKPVGVAKLVGIAAAMSLLAGGVGGAVGYSLADSPSATAISAPVSGGGSASAPADGSIAAVAAAVSPSVVTIAAGQGAGTGFVVRSDGYIVTNNHVVGKESKLEVTFADGAVSQASVVGKDAGYDLAVIKVDRTDLPVVTLGSSANVNVGDTAIALGSPLGLRGTVTSGIVSALDQPVTAGGQGGEQGETSFINALQTDAAINPGNSGGPLVDGNGAVIGVNSAIASLGQGGGQGGGQVGSIGLGFAIPVDTAKRIANELIETGDSRTPVIGIQVNQRFDGSGAQVQSVSPGGPSEGAGLKDGDVIVAVNGKKVTDATELIVLIRDNAVGDSVTLTRQGGDEITVTLGAAE